jgi:putative PIN family toxin of toxin-antitoxin system
MIKVVFDTNILVSAFLIEGSNEWKMLDRAVRGNILLYLSEDILSEFIRVVSRPKFSYTKEKIESMRQMLLRTSRLVTPMQRLTVVVGDPSDNKILECALEAEASYIVSGDRHLLELREYQGIKILSSGEFLRKKQ